MGISPDQQAAQRKSARWARLQLMFELPRLVDVLLSSRLFEHDGEFWLVLDADDDALNTIAATLFRERPMTLRITAVRAAPPQAQSLSTEADTTADAWLVNEPLTKAQINTLFSLADRTLPPGYLDFDFPSQSYEFVSTVDLTTEECQHVRGVANEKLGIPLRRFRTSVEVEAPRYGESTLPTARLLQKLPATVRRLIESDEDTWLDFCDRRDHGEASPRSSLVPERFSGLVDGNAQGAATLADFLAIYDVVNLLPPQSESTWLRTNNLTVAQFQQLATMGRVQLVLPLSLLKYPVGLISAVAEVAPESVVLSRALATRAINEGCKRDPLFYAPIPSEAKAALLGALVQVLPEKLSSAAYQIYQLPLRQQRISWMMEGASAWFHQSLGARLGEALFQEQGRDARLEFMTVGAGLEWGMALGSSYVPRRDDSYDETKLAVHLASVISRRPAREIMPATDSLHLIVDGLLTVGALSPMDVAQLAPIARERFRALARKLMTQATNALELQQAVDAINREVVAFERKRARLNRWEIAALPTGLMAKALSDAADAGVFPTASVIGAWLLLLARSRLPNGLRDEVDALTKSLAAMAMLTPVDAVIVSQTRNAVQRKVAAD